MNLQPAGVKPGVPGADETAHLHPASAPLACQLSFYRRLSVQTLPPIETLFCSLTPFLDGSRAKLQRRVRKGAGTLSADPAIVVQAAQPGDLSQKLR